MKGRKPVPTAILSLRGSKHAAGKIRDGEVRPALGRPRPPDKLREDAIVYYRRLVRQLDTVPGLLSRIDANSLGRYCEMLARYWAASQHVAEHGEFVDVVTKDGAVIGQDQSPESKLTLRLAEKLLKLEIEFGMTPSARSRIRLGDSMAFAARKSVEPSTTAVVTTKADFLA